MSRLKNYSQYLIVILKQPIILIHILSHDFEERMII